MAADILDAVLGVLLAGGKARRMGGGDKCLRPLAGKPILSHVLERVRPQVGPVAIGMPGRIKRPTRDRREHM